MATERTFVKGPLMEMWQRTKQYPDSVILGVVVRGAGILETTWAHPKQTGTQDQAGRRESMQHRPRCCKSGDRSKGPFKASAMENKLLWQKEMEVYSSIYCQMVSALFVPLLSFHQMFYNLLWPLNFKIQGTCQCFQHTFRHLTLISLK